MIPNRGCQKDEGNDEVYLTCGKNEEEMKVFW